MKDIMIDEEFRDLLPALDIDTYARLEQNIIQYGCLFPLVLWNGILVDGYHRLRICTTHDIPFETIEQDFASRDEAVIWIISNQISRRNLAPMQLSYYRGLHYRADRKIVTNPYGRQKHSADESQNATHQKDQSTATRLAKQYKVSRDTILRESKIAAAIDAIGESSPEAKRRILSGEMSINKNVLEGLSSWPKEDIVELAAKIEEGSYERKRTGSEQEGAADVQGLQWPSAQITPGGEGDGVEVSGMSPFEAAIARITEELFAELRKQSSTEDVKSALRSYINMLEDLYSQII